MVLSEFVGAVLRRWYVVLVGLLVTAGLAYVAFTHSPPTYTARGLVVLLPSEKEAPGGANPFLDLAGLELPARVVVAYFESETAQDAAAKVAPHATVSVTMEESTRGPVIAIDTEASSTDEALTALNYVAGEIPKALTRLQDQVDVPSTSTIGSMPLTMDGKAKKDNSKVMRLTILAAGLGVGATAFLAFALDGLLLRRRGIRRETRAEAPEVRPAPKLVRDTDDDRAADADEASARRVKLRGRGVGGVTRG
jgi:hypothetical protein